MVKHIAFTAYPSNDVAGTRRWYEETLGLVFAGAYVEDGVEKYNEAHLGDGCFSLMAAEWTHRAPGSASSVYFEVDGRVARSEGHSHRGPVCGPRLRAGIVLRSRGQSNHDSRGPRPEVLTRERKRDPLARIPIRAPIPALFVTSRRASRCR
jgi:hypothetical protein